MATTYNLNGAVVYAPHCHKCGVEMLLMRIDEKTFSWRHTCGKTPKIYINHCHSCKSPIDSRVCIKSKKKGMGYHCPTCGKDLTEWKQRFRRAA